MLFILLARDVLPTPCYLFWDFWFFFIILCGLLFVISFLLYEESSVRRLINSNCSKGLRADGVSASEPFIRVLLREVREREAQLDILCVTFLFTCAIFLNIKKRRVDRASLSFTLEKMAFLVFFLCFCNSTVLSFGQDGCKRSEVNLFLCYLFMPFQKTELISNRGWWVVNNFGKSSCGLC